MDYKVLILFLFASISMHSQFKVSGTVIDASTNTTMANVEVFDKQRGLLTKTNAQGYYEFQTVKNNLTLVFFYPSYVVSEQEIVLNQDLLVDVYLEPISALLYSVSDAPLYFLSNSVNLFASLPLILSAIHRTSNGASCP